MKKIYKISLILCTILLFLNMCSSTESKRYVYQKKLMYTSFDIVIYSNTPKFLLNSKINNVWDTLDNLEYDLSATGEGFVATLNKEGFIAKDTNPETFQIVSNFITRSKVINQQSDGAFDLTVYPLIRLWGFYLQDKEKRIPTDQEIKDTLKHVGMNNIIFTNNGILLQNDVKLDLGAIAKGYAVDVAVEMLKDITNISAGFVNAGGNVKVYGGKPDGTPWRVGIRNPNGQEVAEIIALYDGEAIATSGDYEQFFEVDGQKYHHIFNPKTGKPVTHNLASVSVVLKGKAEETDLLATTFLSMGTKKSKELLIDLDRDQQYSIFYIERDNDTLLTEANDAWLKRKQ